MILDCCLLLTQNDKQLIKIVEKLFELNIENRIHPAKHIILKNYSMFYSEMENSVIQPSNASQ